MATDISVVHKLRPTYQIRPMTHHQMAHEVQQKSLKYEKYGTSYCLTGITVTLTLTVSTFCKNLELNDVVIFLCVFNATSTLFSVCRTISIFSCVPPRVLRILFVVLGRKSLCTTVLYVSSNFFQPSIWTSF